MQNLNASPEFSTDYNTYVIIQSCYNCSLPYLFAHFELSRLQNYCMSFRAPFNFLLCNTPCFCLIFKYVFSPYCSHRHIPGTASIPTLLF